MEHVVSKRITNVKKLSAWQVHELKARRELERLDRINYYLNKAIIIFGILTFLNLLNYFTN